MIRKYYIDGTYLFSIINGVAYLDINLESDKDINGWVETEIRTNYGIVVRLLYCKSRIFKRVCGAVVRLNRDISEEELEKAYNEIVQSIRNTIGKP